MTPAERVQFPPFGWFEHYQNGLNLLKSADQAAADADDARLDAILTEIRKHFARAQVDLQRRMKGAA